MARLVALAIWCAVLVAMGTALGTAAPMFAVVLVIIGILPLTAFLVIVYWRAGQGDQARAWDPGSLRREDQSERSSKPEQRTRR